mgnify:CR=1 FL=1
MKEGITVEAFLAIMGTRVGRSTLFGIPLQQQWSARVSGTEHGPTYYLQSDAPLYYYSFTDAWIAMAYKSLTPAEQARFDPMITGFNPADMYAVDHIRRVLEQKDVNAVVIAAPDHWHAPAAIMALAAASCGLCAVPALAQDAQTLHRLLEFSPREGRFQRGAESPLQADLVIVLSHCGFQADRELAAQVPEIDVIVGGHSAGGHFASAVGARLAQVGYPYLKGAVLFDPVAAGVAAGGAASSAAAPPPAKSARPKRMGLMGLPLARSKPAVSSKTNLYLSAALSRTLCKPLLRSMAGRELSRFSPVRKKGSPPRSASTLTVRKQRSAPRPKSPLRSSVRSAPTMAS